MSALCTPLVSYTVINGQWEDEDEAQEAGKVKTRPAWWPAGYPQKLTHPPSLSLSSCLCIPLLTCCSFSSGLFDKLPVLMPLVQCPLSTPINSYIYQSFLLRKKEGSIIKVIKNDL